MAHELIRLGIAQTHLPFIIGLHQQISLLQTKPERHQLLSRKLKNSLGSISFANFTVTAIALQSNSSL